MSFRQDNYFKKLSRYRLIRQLLRFHVTLEVWDSAFCRTEGQSKIILKTNRVFRNTLILVLVSVQTREYIRAKVEVLTQNDVLMDMDACLSDC